LCPGFVHTEFHDAIEMKGFTRERTAGSMWMTAEEVVACSLRCLSTKQVIVIPGLGYSIFGRLAQMPALQPLMRWITRVPRLPSSCQPVAESCLEPAVVVAGLTADLTASIISSPETAALVLADRDAPPANPASLQHEDLEHESRSRADNEVQVAVGGNATPLSTMSGITAI